MTPPGSSPLEEIERHVTARATRSTIDVDASGGERALRALIDEVIDEWSDDHRRGQRDHALSDPDGLAERAFRNLARYGPLTELLEDDDVWEIMVNAPDLVLCRHTARSSSPPGGPTPGS